MEARLQALEARVAELEIDRELLVSCVVALASLARVKLSAPAPADLPAIAAELEGAALLRKLR